MRLLVDKAIPDFALHARGQTELDWRDLVVANLEQRLIDPEFPTRDLSRADAVAAEHRILRRILASHETRSERVHAWKRETGKSQASFYRRLQEVRRASHPAEFT